MQITFSPTHATLTKSDYEIIRGFAITHGFTDLPQFPESPAKEVMIADKPSEVKFTPKPFDQKH